MMLAGKKVVVVGGSSGIGLVDRRTRQARRRRCHHCIPQRRAAECGRRQDWTPPRSRPMSPAMKASNDLFRACGPVDHVVVTAAQLRTGPFKTVAMEDVRATMEGKFWGAWRVARSAEIRPGGSLTLVSGFLSIRPRPNSAIVGAANGAIESLARSLALELAPVRVNASRRGSSTRRSAPRCRKRRAATCWPRRPPACRSAASASAKISRGRSSPS